MPYIDPPSRGIYDTEITDLVAVLTGLRTRRPTPGVLNYTITRIVLGCLRAAPITYTYVNELIGVLECVKQELYRRHVAPYEDAKKDQNGDV